jgi:hypothetical protein
LAEPLVRLVLSKDGAPEVGPIKIAFHFDTDIGRVKFSGSGTIKEICELVPMQIQNAGALCRMAKVLGGIENTHQRV